MSPALALSIHAAGTLRAGSRVAGRKVLGLDKLQERLDPMVRFGLMRYKN